MRKKPNTQSVFRRTREYHLANWLGNRVKQFQMRLAKWEQAGLEFFAVEKMTNQERRRWNSLIRDRRLQPKDVLLSIFGAERLAKIEADFEAAGKPKFEPFTGPRVAIFEAMCAMALARKKARELAENGVFVQEQTA